jgi:HSP20 family protein
MASITRFRPWDDTMDDFFRGFFVRPVGYESPPAGAAAFRVDVSENDTAYTLRAELPGVKKEDIAITVDGETVAVSAEVKNENETRNGEQVLRSERHYGRLYRAFTLGQPVDEAQAQARYADGILQLVLPKKAAAQAKRITIQ